MAFYDHSLEGVKYNWYWVSKLQLEINYMLLHLNQKIRLNNSEKPLRIIWALFEMNMDSIKQRISNYRK